MKQAGGVAAPVGGQILSEVLPYLELQKDNITEEIIQVEVPDFRNKTVKKAKKAVFPPKAAIGSTLYRGAADAFFAFQLDNIDIR